MNDKVERVARALCSESGDSPDEFTYAYDMKCTGRDREPQFRWMYWVSFAKSAIEAMNDR